MINNFLWGISSRGGGIRPHHSRPSSDGHGQVSGHHGVYIPIDQIQDSYHKKSLLTFVTGNDRIPVGSLKRLKFILLNDEWNVDVIAQGKLEYIVIFFSYDSSSICHERSSICHHVGQSDCPSVGLSVGLFVNNEFQEVFYSYWMLNLALERL